MEYIYASMLLHAVKKDINEANLKKVLEAAGVHAEEGRVRALVSALEGINIDEAIKEAAMAPVTSAPAASQAASQASKKEEKKTEEETAASLSSLFG